MNHDLFLLSLAVALLAGLIVRAIVARRGRPLSFGKRFALFKGLTALTLAEPTRAFLLPALGLELTFLKTFLAIIGALFLFQAAVQYWREERRGVALADDEISWDFCVLAGAIMLIQAQVSGGVFHLLPVAFLVLSIAARKRREQLDAARQRDLILGRIAHELRVPAAAVRVLAESLERDRVRDDQERRRYAGLLVLEAQRLSRGLERSLQVARGAEPPPLEKVPLDLVEWAEGLRDRWRALLPKLTLDAPKSLPAAVDPERLDEAFDALLDNAMRYGKEPIELTLREAGGAVELRLTQSGDGVPEALRPVLDRRMRGELESDPEARGLGCWAAGAVARAHGGDLMLEGPRTFTMTLPRSPEA